MTKKLALAAAMVLAVAGSASAQSGPNLIEIRQVGMALQTGDFGGINAVVTLKGDVKPLEARAKAIARWAALIPSLFPAGTQTGNNTKALPEIWSDSAGFQKAAMALGAAATELADAAKSGDADAVAVKIKAVGEACGACHKAYRAK